VIKTIIIAVMLCFSLLSIAADYEYIDSGDYYYINNFSENDYVRVVKKVGDGKVKVRDAYSGETQIVNSSELLTQNELDSEETRNAVAGWATGLGLLYCLSNSDRC